MNVDMKPAYRRRHSNVALRGDMRHELSHVIVLRLVLGCMIATSAVAEGGPAQSRRLRFGWLGPEDSLSSQDVTSNAADGERKGEERSLLSSLPPPSSELLSFPSPSRPTRQPLVGSSSLSSATMLPAESLTSASETPSLNSEWRSSTELFNLSSPLIIKGSIKVVRSHPDMSDRDPWVSTNNLVSNVVLSPTNDLYYLHWLRCNSSGIYPSCPGVAGQESHLDLDGSYLVLWVKRVHLSDVDSGTKPKKDEQTELLFRYPIRGPNWTYITPSAMALSSDGTHLVLLESSFTIAMGRFENRDSVIALLSLAESSLSFVPLRVIGYSLAVGSAAPVAYFSAARDKKYIWSITVNGSGNPLPGTKPKGVEKAFTLDREEEPPSVEEDSRKPIASDIVFQSQSLASSGHCMYYSQRALFNSQQRVAIVGFDPLPSKSKKVPRLIASYEFLGEDKIFCGAIRDIVTTEDGCHVFAAVNCFTWSILLSVKLASPCSEVTTVEKILEYHGGELWSLALHRDGDGLSLYTGSTDGKLFRLQLNSSEIAVCE